MSEVTYEHSTARESWAGPVNSCGAVRTDRDGVLPDRAVDCAARAGDRRFGLSSALRAHANAPYKSDLLRRTIRSRKPPEGARTGGGVGYAHHEEVLAERGGR
jgi:hypothetical protein